MEVDGEVVNELSGPITYFLLEPKREEFGKYPGMYPPVVLIFGDLHVENSGQCANSKYRVSDSSFLSLFNNLAKQYTIDISIESFTSLDIKTVEEGKKVFREEYAIWKTDNSFLKNMINNNIWCFYNAFKSKCPEPNLKWHHADIRLNKNRIYNSESNLNLLAVDNLNGVFRYDPINTRVLRTILLDKLNGTSNYITYFFENQDFISKSLIHKQLRKQCDALKDMSLWRKWFTEYYIKDLVLIDLPKVNVLQYFDNSIKQHYNDPITCQIYNMIWRMLSINVDFYYLTRMFKIPTGASNPILSLGYFGAHHTECIAYFLTNIMKLYNVNHKQKDYSEANPNRCLVFSKFNMNEILHTYKNLRTPKYTIENIFTWNNETLTSSLALIKKVVPSNDINQKRIAIINYTYLKGYLDRKEINKYGIKKVEYVLPKSNTYTEFIKNLEEFYTLEKIFTYNEQQLSSYLNFKSKYPEPYNIREERSLVIDDLYNKNYIDKTILDKYEPVKIKDVLKKADTYAEFLSLIQQTYTIKDIFNYTDLNFDKYLAYEQQINHPLTGENIQYRSATLYEKRLIVLDRLYDTGYLDKKEINFYGMNNVTNSLKRANNYNEFISILNSQM